MATRMTAAEKRAIAQAQSELRWAAEWTEFTSTYTQRLLDAALFFASTPGFRVRPLEVGNYEFIAERSDYCDYNRTVVMSVEPEDTYTWETMGRMTELEGLITEYREFTAAAARKAALRASALEKLSKEEREVLGL